MTSLHSAGPKIGSRWKQRTIIFWGSRLYSQFCPKIRCHDNGGWQERNL